MRLNDLRLLEFAPTRTVFNHIINNTAIHMGFECEFYTDQEPQEGRESPDVDEWDWSDLNGNVRISRRQSNQISSEFSEWKTEKADEELGYRWKREADEYTRDWCRDNGHLDADEPEEGEEAEGKDEDAIIEEYKDEAREAFFDENRDEAYDEFDDMDEFIKDKYGSMSRFMSEFDLEFYDDDAQDEVSAETVHEEIAEQLRKLTGYSAVRGYNSNPKRWTVMEDGSLSDSEYISAEIASPVFSLAEGLTMMQKIFKWMKRSYYTTDETTGLHVSFSIEGKDESDYDFLKMAMLFDENYTAQLFDRMDNEYAQQIRATLFANFKASGENPVANMSERQMSDVIAKMRDVAASMKFDSYTGVGNSKYFSFRHRRNGVVEFRGMGNSDYEDKYDVIRKRVVNMAYLMVVGSDPKMMAREYVSRIYKMLNSAKFSDPTLGSGLGRIDPPQNLSAFAKMFAIEPKTAKMAQSDPMNFLQVITGKLTQGWTLDPLQLRQLRFYIARNKLNAETIRMYLHDAGYNRLASVMRWPLVVPGKHDPNQQVLPFASQGEDLSGTPHEPANPNAEQNTSRDRINQYRQRRLRVPGSYQDI